MCLRPFGLYCSACLGILFVSILCTCCSHFYWYCFISFTIFSAPVFSPNTSVFFSLSSFVIPRRCLKNFICAASKRCSSLFFSTQASLPLWHTFGLKFWNHKKICSYITLTINEDRLFVGLYADANWFSTKWGGHKKSESLNLSNFTAFYKWNKGGATLDCMKNL